MEGGHYVQEETFVFYQKTCKAFHFISTEGLNFHQGLSMTGGPHKDEKPWE